VEFLHHAFLVTEVDVRSVFSSNRMWTVFEKHFIVELVNICNASLSEAAADIRTQNYVTDGLTIIVKIFFERILTHSPSVILVFYSENFRESVPNFDLMFHITLTYSSTGTQRCLHQLT
jgi:hypothetical protein